MTRNTRHALNDTSDVLYYWFRFQYIVRQAFRAKRRPLPLLEVFVFTTLVVTVIMVAPLLLGV